MASTDNRQPDAPLSRSKCGACGALSRPLDTQQQSSPRRENADSTVGPGNTGDFYNPRFFPRSLRLFPRRSWIEAELAAGYAHNADLGGRGQCAAKVASQKWLEAIKTGNIGDLDEVDFGLAVFDKVVEQNEWIRDRRAEACHFISTSQEWQRESERCIDHALDLCYRKVSRKFPNSTKLPQFADSERYKRFLREALRCTWCQMDSNRPPDDPPTDPFPMDEITYWVGRYSPEWKISYPVLATMVDLEWVGPADEQPKVTYLWLDENNNEVDPPAGWVHPDDRKSEHASGNTSSPKGSSSGAVTVDEPAELDLSNDIKLTPNRVAAQGDKDGHQVEENSRGQVRALGRRKTVNW